MEQPLTPKSSQPKETPTTTTTSSSNNKKKMKRPPTPEEVLAHYESQGLESRAASLKAISDLQTLLFRSVASSSSSGRGKMDRLLADKLDNANTRLAILETKLDSKPSFPESIAIGVTSGAIFHAISSAVPHLTRIWDSVNSATKTSH